jgi:hypothetical protein
MQEGLLFRSKIGNLKYRPYKSNKSIVRLLLSFEVGLCSFELEMKSVHKRKA